MPWGRKAPFFAVSCLCTGVAFRAAPAWLSSGFFFSSSVCLCQVRGPGSVGSLGPLLTLLCMFLPMGYVESFLSLIQLSHFLKLPVKSIAGMPVPCLAQLEQLPQASRATCCPCSLASEIATWTNNTSNQIILIWQSICRFSRPSQSWTSEVTGLGGMRTAPGDSVLFFSGNSVVFTNKCFSVCWMSVVDFSSTEVVVFNPSDQLYSCFLVDYFLASSLCFATS